MRKPLVAIWSVVVLASCAAEKVIERTEPQRAEQEAAELENHERFAQAYWLLREGRYEAALPIFSDLSQNYPQLADYHLYFLGYIDARVGDIADAEAALTRLLAEYPQSVKVDEASLELGKTLLDKGEYATADVFLERGSASANRDVRDAARLALAEIAVRQGNVAKANDELMSIRRGAGARPVGREAKRALMALRKHHPQLAPTGIRLVEETKLLLDERDYAAAELAVETLLESPPQNVRWGELVRLQAEAQLGRGRLDEGLATLWKVADEDPRSNAAPAALFRLASLLWNRDRDAAALRAFREFQARYPRDRRVADAIYAEARIHQAADKEAEAIEAYREILRRFPRRDLAAEAKWRIGWIHYGARRWEEATVIFAELADTTRGKRHDEAMYWRARSHENAGRDGRARQLYGQIVASGDDGPYGAYYAAWAQARLASLSQRQAKPFSLRAGEKVSLPRSIEPAAPASVSTFHLERWRELRAARLKDLARDELAAIERQSAGDEETIRFLIEAYQTVDGFRRARALASKVGRRAGLSSSARRRLLYPLGFWNLVEEKSRQDRLDPLWVVAIMRQESMFDPEAHSPADARGLMQLLPSTAARVAEQIRLEPAGEIDLTQPQTNIQLGTAYLRTLIDRFNGDMLKAVAAYNGGEPAVERWQAQFGTLDADEFVESITYRETRDYVKRVAGNYQVYRDLYVTTLSARETNDAASARR